LLSFCEEMTTLDKDLVHLTVHASFALEVPIETKTYHTPLGKDSRGAPQATPSVQDAPDDTLCAGRTRRHPARWTLCTHKTPETTPPAHHRAQLVLPRGLRNGPLVTCARNVSYEKKTITSGVFVRECTEKTSKAETKGGTSCCFVVEPV